MAEQQRQSLCPRLIDYLAIVGARTHVPHKAQQPGQPPPIEVPSILRRYPINDHDDFRMPLDMVYFCQPEGTNSVGSRKVGAAVRDATSFVFTLTDKDSGKTRYGICVNFYRPIERGGSSAAQQQQHHAVTAAAAAASPGGQQRSTALRRDSWRKSIDKSSDSAFSRQVFSERGGRAFRHSV